MPPTLYLLCGLAFSGKSTLAGALATHADAAVVSLDEINARRGLFGGEGMPVAEWAKSHEIALGEVESLMRRARPRIVVDDTNCFRFLRDAFRTVARRNGYNSLVILLDTPLAEIRSRMDATRRNGDRRLISDENFAMHHDSFEWPRDQETCLVYAASEAVEPWIKTKLLARHEPGEQSVSGGLVEIR